MFVGLLATITCGAWLFVALYGFALRFGPYCTDSGCLPALPLWGVAELGLTVAGVLGVGRAYWRWTRSWVVSTGPDEREVRLRQRDLAVPAACLALWLVLVAAVPP